MEDILIGVAEETAGIDKVYNRHFITLDENGRVMDGFSNAFREPSETDICINEYGGYQFRLIYAECNPDAETMASCRQSEENPPLFEFTHMIPLYRWDVAIKQVVKRTTEEIEADIAALPAPGNVPTTGERVSALEETTSALEEAICEMDAANEERMVAIEEALCELDMG